MAHISLSLTNLKRSKFDVITFVEDIGIKISVKCDVQCQKQNVIKL